MRVVNPTSSGVGRICRDQPCPPFVGVLVSHDHAIWIKLYSDMHYIVQLLVYLTSRLHTLVCMSAPVARHCRHFRRAKLTPSLKPIQYKITARCVTQHHQGCSKNSENVDVTITKVYSHPCTYINSKGHHNND